MKIIKIKILFEYGRNLISKVEKKNIKYQILKYAKKTAKANSLNVKDLIQIKKTISKNENGIY